MAEVTAVNVYQARYRVPIARATAGNLVLIEGIDATITKTATLVAEAYDEPVCIFRYELITFHLKGPYLIHTLSTQAPSVPDPECGQDRYRAAQPQRAAQDG